MSSVKVSSVKKDLIKSKNKWILYVLPNASLEVFESVEKTPNFDKKYYFLQEAKNLVGGELIYGV